jgi:hypothetical protein
MVIFFEHFFARSTLMRMGREDTEAHQGQTKGRHAYIQIYTGA